MVKLIDYKSETISRGCVLRFPAVWPYENYVDLLVVDMPNEDSNYGLVVTTGHKAGLILVLLPNECKALGCRAINCKWVLENWNKWIYSDCSVEDVLILEHYDVPI